MRQRIEAADCRMIFKATRSAEIGPGPVRNEPRGKDFELRGMEEADEEEEEEDDPVGFMRPCVVVVESVYSWMM